MRAQLHGATLEDSQLGFLFFFFKFVSSSHCKNKLEIQVWINEYVALDFFELSFIVWPQVSQAAVFIMVFQLVVLYPEF